MDRKQVLFLTGSLNVGGTERNILHLATRLDPERFDIEVWSDYEGEPLQRELQAQGVTCRVLKGAPSLGKPWPVRLFRHNLPYQWRLFRLLRSRRRAVVHAFGFPMAYYATLLGRLAGCRRIFFAVQDWDVWKKSWVYRLLDRIISRLAWRVIADGEGARRLAIEKQGMKAEKLITIYDGVNTEELTVESEPRATRERIGLEADRPVAGVVARLDLAKKAQDVFLAAIPGIAKAHPGAQFLLVGDGPDRERIEQMIADLPEGKRPVMAGSRSDLADVLAALDVLVICSRWESVPKVLLEAMWLERPIVATRVGDIAEVLDASCGRLVSPDEPDALAAAVCDLLADPADAQRLGRRAKERIIERRLTLEDSVKQYEALYSEA